jgi:hypothetical protein
MQITFKESLSGATDTKDFPIGSILPKDGDLIVSPFTDGKTALVNEIAGDLGADNAYVLVTE